MYAAVRKKVHVLEAVLKVFTRTLGYQSVLNFLSEIYDSGEKAPSEVADKRIKAPITHFLHGVLDRCQRLEEMNGVVLVVLVRIVREFKRLLLE